MTSTDMPAGIVNRPADTGTQAEPGEWTETVLTLLFTASAVLFVSFLAVVTGLV
ncbi:MAG TPA: hypothetical protein VMC05_12700 [Xanthobacteraceae bacterium]|nr:hypothetical protein [Xanthobacteraceae bacterium]